MPCKDITEILKLRLDDHGHLSTYSLTKATCGGSVGQEDLLIPFVKGIHISELAELSPQEFIAGHTTGNDLTTFLYFKHIKALSLGIRALTGGISASASDATAIESISYDGRELEVSAVLKSTLGTDNIKSCGCG